MEGLGWVKMRGKKSKVLGCGCCVAEDRRDEIRWKEAANEIQANHVPDGHAIAGEFDYMDQIDAMQEVHDAVDDITYAKYTWAVGLSEPRIRAILAQRQADYLKRYADIYDAMHASGEFDRMIAA